MATLVFVHAHPDDEASATAGSMARAAAEGHRVVLVVCTNGDHGESPDDLADGETLVDRRRRETERSGAALGVARIAWLGYRDSGMSGWPQNEEEGAFASAPVDDAAERLAAILREERAEVVVVYDWHGSYGHPDHVQVHRVGHRAADLAGTPKRFEVTFNRDVGRRLMQQWKAVMAEASTGSEQEWDMDAPGDDGNPIGTPEAEIHLGVDVSPWLEAKRTALAAHASQVTDAGGMLAMPVEAFAAMFGTEWYIEPGAGPGLRSGWLLDGWAS
jgi:LmbE family N-acetylglucosaminyl deacetylase